MLARRGRKASCLKTPRQQLLNVAQLPFIYKWVAAMPDVHWGIGATVGSVIPTRGAIIPAAVCVDIGCGMMAVKTSLYANHLPDNLHGIRTAVEKATPVGRTDNGGRTTVARGPMLRRTIWTCGRRWSLHIRRSSISTPS